jgi:DNA-binding transcriptional ArsR family regulator
MAKQLEQMEGLFRALADATRLRILGLLLTGEVPCAGNLLPTPTADQYFPRFGFDRITRAEAPAGEEAAWAPVREAFERVPGLQLAVIKRHRAGLTALAAVDLIASAVLLVGGLVVRRRTASSLRLLNTGLVLSQAYAALKLGIQTWVQVDLYRALSPILRDLARQGEAGATTAQVTLFAQSATIVVMAVVALAELLFYAYAQRYLRRPDVARFLSGGPAPLA